MSIRLSGPGSNNRGGDGINYGNENNRGNGRGNNSRNGDNGGCV